MTPERFQEIRKELKHTKASLSRAWRVTRQTISIWESGKAPVPAWVGWAFGGMKMNVEMGDKPT